jgi:predicted dithiol-disulfide oxidoreductase (DUF899 family)
VSFKPEQLAAGATYNYGKLEHPMSDMPGISVFARDEGGAIFHTYSCYARGLDMMNTAYHYSTSCPRAATRGRGSWPG